MYRRTASRFARVLKGCYQYIVQKYRLFFRLGPALFYCRESHVINCLIVKLTKMRWISFLIVLISLGGFAQERYQWKEYKLNPRGDTINRVDHLGRKQGPWVHRYETVRGEPGYEEEGWYENNRKEGAWRLYALTGDLVGTENYKWGLKDGIARYFTKHGELKLEQSWKALNPDKAYDTIQVEDIDKLDSYKEVIIKNEGAAIKHGIWKYYGGTTGTVIRSDR